MFGTKLMILLQEERISIGKKFMGYSNRKTFLFGITINA